MKKVFVSRRVEKKLNKGQVVLEEIDFPDLSETDQEVELFSQNKQFLGKAYLSRQNKGIGWFITNFMTIHKIETIDSSIILPYPREIFLPSSTLFSFIVFQ